VVAQRFGVRQLAAAFAARACSSRCWKQASGEGKRQQAAALQNTIPQSIQEVGAVEGVAFDGAETRLFDSERFKRKFVTTLADLRGELGFRIVG
jgi:hypothetical protein